MVSLFLLCQRISVSHRCTFRISEGTWLFETFFWLSRRNNDDAGDCGDSLERLSAMDLSITDPIPASRSFWWQIKRTKSKIGWSRDRRAKRGVVISGATCSSRCRSAKKRTSPNESSRLFTLSGSRSTREATSSIRPINSIIIISTCFHLSVGDASSLLPIVADTLPAPALKAVRPAWTSSTRAKTITLSCPFLSPLVGFCVCYYFTLFEFRLTKSKSDPAFCAESPTLDQTPTGLPEKFRSRASTEGSLSYQKKKRAAIKIHLQMADQHNHQQDHTPHSAENSAKGSCRRMSISLRGREMDIQT